MSKDFSNSKTVAIAIDEELRALKVKNTPNRRALRRKYTQLLKDAELGFMLELAQDLVQNYGHRGFAYELIRYHKATFASLGVAELENLGQGINSWWTVDAFGRILSGPAWLKGQISDVVYGGFVHDPEPCGIHGFRAYIELLGNLFGT